jgi:HAD superfamily hydrolase (TIGR01549 family)
MQLSLLFDLDGTLMDTFDLILPAMNRTMEEFSVKPFAPEELRPMIGMPVQRQLEQLRGITGPVAERITDRYYEQFSAFVDQGVGLFSGVAETLPRLAEGRAIGTMTTRRRIEARHMLRVTGIEPYFRAVVGGDDAPRPKPYPDLPRLAAASIGMPPEHCIVVGDSPVDILAGRAARTWTVAAMYGYGRPEAIREAKPHAEITRFPELERVVADFETRAASV